MARYAARVVGVDKSENRLARARTMRAQANATYHLLDCTDVAALLRLRLPFTKIFIDVSGNRDAALLVTLMEQYEAAFRPQLLVVKSYKLKRLLGLACVFDARRPDDMAPLLPPPSQSATDVAGPFDGARRQPEGASVAFSCAVWLALFLPGLAAAAHAL